VASMVPMTGSPDTVHGTSDGNISDDCGISDCLGRQNGISGSNPDGSSTKDFVSDAMETLVTLTTMATIPTYWNCIRINIPWSHTQRKSINKNNTVVLVVVGNDNNVTGWTIVDSKQMDHCRWQAREPLSIIKGQG
jgi:hypothetical protein